MFAIIKHHNKSRSFTTQLKLLVICSADLAILIATFIQIIHVLSSSSTIRSE